MACVHLFLREVVGKKVTREEEGDGGSGRRGRHLHYSSRAADVSHGDGVWRRHPDVARDIRARSPPVTSPSTLPASDPCPPPFFFFLVIRLSVSEKSRERGRREDERRRRGEDV